MGKESQTEGENWQDLSWTRPVIISRRPGETALNIYLEPYSMLSRKGWFPVSGMKVEKHKATMQERQQKNTGSCVLILWKTARAEMPPADQTKATIPRPVDLKAELRTGLEDF